MLWVTMVCLSQNSGFSQTCSTPNHTVSQQEAGKQISPQCDLSEKLVQAHQNHFDHVIVPLLLFTVFLTLAISSRALAYLDNTEPIPEKYRVHLKLCVFRE
ncbi:hypothetical protein ATG66_1115 [Vibrio sp. ES.051]|nr:hypothetical protein ATG66_1115 [Vibrio sp. ES.051]